MASRPGFPLERVATAAMKLLASTMVSLNQLGVLSVAEK